MCIRDSGTEGRPVQLVFPALLEDVASMRAGLALRAVIDRQHKRFEEGPGVRLAEQLFEAGQEAFDQRLFRLGAGGTGQGNRDGVVERAFAGRAHLGGERWQCRLLVLVVGGRQGHPVFVLKRAEPLGRPADAGEGNGGDHGLPSSRARTLGGCLPSPALSPIGRSPLSLTRSVAKSTHVFSPFPRMCGALQPTLWASWRPIAASSFEPTRFTSSSQRTSWYMNHLVKKCDMCVSG